MELLFIMRKLQFNPESGTPFSDPEPHYAALTQAEQALPEFSLPTPEELIAVTRSAQLAVKSEIHYTNEHLDPHDARIDEASERRLTTCIGLAYNLSNLIESVGVRHHVGYAAGHAYLLSWTTEGPYFVDSMYEDVTKPLAMLPVIGPEEVPEIVEAFADLSGYVSARFKAERLKRGGNLDFINTPSTFGHPWEKARHPVRFRAAEAALGRSSLRAFEGFWQAMRRDDYTEAADVLRRNSDIYPEIESDIRFNTSGQKIRSVLAAKKQSKSRINEEEADQLEIVINALCDIFDADGFEAQMRGDLLCSLGDAARKRHFWLGALECYTRATSVPGGSYVEQKAHKVGKKIRDDQLGQDFIATNL